MVTMISIPILISALHTINITNNKCKTKEIYSFVSIFFHLQWLLQNEPVEFIFFMHLQIPTSIFFLVIRIISLLAVVYEFGKTQIQIFALVVNNDKKRHRSDAQEWYFRLMNGPEYFEEWTTVGFLE